MIRKKANSKYSYLLHVVVANVLQPNEEKNGRTLFRIHDKKEETTTEEAKPVEEDKNEETTTEEAKPVEEDKN